MKHVIIIFALLLTGLAGAGEPGTCRDFTDAAGFQHRKCRAHEVATPLYCVLTPDRTGEVCIEGVPPTRTSPSGWREQKRKGVWVSVPAGCTEVQCHDQAARTCGIRGLSRFLYDGPNSQLCGFMCPGDTAWRNITNCGGGGGNIPATCCGYCPGGCVDAETGVPSTLPCCPAPPDDDDVTRPL